MTAWNNEKAAFLEADKNEEKVTEYKDFLEKMDEKSKKVIEKSKKTISEL